MASGYASRLSDYRCKGECGLPESRDSSRSVTLKIKRLVELVKDASQVVIITGAGISTAAGIRDFRGPNGVWTKEKEARSQSNGASKKRKRQWISREPAQQPPVVDSFLQARPTLTHRAITKLVLEGVVCFCKLRCFVLFVAYVV